MSNVKNFFLPSSSNRRDACDKRQALDSLQDCPVRISKTVVSTLRNTAIEKLAEDMPTC